MFIVYVIRNQSVGKIYIGYTSDLDKRLDRHNGKLPSKKKSFTHRNKGDWKLVYKEEYKTREEARKREKQLKSYRGREFIKKMIIENL